jgi:hypothetical protein
MPSDERDEVNKEIDKKVEEAAAAGKPTHVTEETVRHGNTLLERYARPEEVADLVPLPMDKGQILLAGDLILKRGDLTDIDDKELKELEAMSAAFLGECQLRGFGLSGYEQLRLMQAAVASYHLGHEAVRDMTALGKPREAVPSPVKALTLGIFCLCHAADIKLEYVEQARLLSLFTAAYRLGRESAVQAN